MTRSDQPAEWGRLAHLFDEINASLIDYDEQVAFLLACRDRFVPDALTALDLGCATGPHARRLAEHGLRATGIDVSPRLIEQGLREASAPTLICADTQALPLRGPYDVVYCLNFVFSFLHTNEAIHAALSEIRRVLSPGGVFIMDYHVYFPPEEGDALAPGWKERCRVRGQKLVMHHRPTVDWRAQLSTDCITYQFMEGREVVREVEATEVRRIMLPQDLLCILEASGFEIVSHCSRFDIDGDTTEMGAVVARRQSG